MDEDTETIALSALQHYLFCPRQCALIHVEQAWAENLFTAEGRLLHEKTDKPGSLKRKGVRVATAMPLSSSQLRVSGIADVVELHKENGILRPYPVEYKRGRPKAHRADEVQLCAQAICLEEMFGVKILEGALFYGKTRRRQQVALDKELRTLTKRIATETYKLIASKRTLPPVYEERRCNACSLKDICRPKRLQKTGSVTAWLSRRIGEEEAP